MELASRLHEALTQRNAIAEGIAYLVSRGHTPSKSQIDRWVAADKEVLAVEILMEGSAA